MLKHPTEAETVLADHAAGRVASVATAARRRGADVDRHAFGPDPRTEYTFDDDTTLVVRGRGRSWRAEALLP